MHEKDMIQIMIERIVAGFAPERVILFGSQARGDTGPHSDIDLLVVLSQVADKRQTVIQIRQALADLPAAKDVFVTTPQEIKQRGDLVGSVLRPALREGKVLYERS
jgi:uncharacterized protein